MTAKYSFRLQSQDKKRALPSKIILAQDGIETVAHVVLKLLAFVLFHRERMQLGGDLHNDSIPFTPDLVQLDYELRPKLWVECGECSLNKLNKLAVKVPEAEIWIVKPSLAAAQDLIQAMAKRELRRDRYNVIGLDQEMFAEVCAMLQPRNELTWVRGGFDPPQMQFDLNGLWFDAPFAVLGF